MNSVLQVKDLSVAFGFDKNGKPRDGMPPLQVNFLRWWASLAAERA